MEWEALEKAEEQAKELDLQCKPEYYEVDNKPRGLPQFLAGYHKRRSPQSPDSSPSTKPSKKLPGLLLPTKRDLGPLSQLSAAVNDHKNQVRAGRKETREERNWLQKASDALLEWAPIILTGLELLL
jgi:hypothetical protein